jgi:hypothetical protein
MVSQLRKYGKEMFGYRLEIHLSGVENPTSSTLCTFLYGVTYKCSFILYFQHFFLKHLLGMPKKIKQDWN